MLTRFKSGQSQKEELRDQALAYLNEVFRENDPLRVPDFSGRYEYEQELGNGRFGAIQKLLDRSTFTFVAAKVVNVDLFNHWIQDGAKIRTRIDTFLREYKRIRAASLLTDRVANFLGIAADLEKVVVLSEFAEKGSVKDQLQREALSEQQALKYFFQATDGLEFLHKQSPPIVHMDIKAANLLVTAADNVKLANFGLVRDLTIGGFRMAVASEISEDFRGTLLYVAPEVLTSDLGPGDRRAYDRPADVWALGCTFVEMLTRFPPYFEFYDDKAGFYTDFESRARGPVTRQLPYDCFSLVPSASTVVRFLVNKVFDKNPRTRISAEGLVNFMRSLDEDCVSQKEHLEGEFEKAVEETDRKRSPAGAQERRNIFASLKAISVQSLSKVTRKPQRKGTSLEDLDEVVSLATLEDGLPRPPPPHSKRKRRRHLFKDLSFCCCYCSFRFMYFTGILCKSISYVAGFVLIGIATLSSFLLAATAVVWAVRAIAASLCQCDIYTPQILIISGIFLILLFALFFSCCMVALGEYKFRVTNKSLHESRFFVRRPSQDVRLLGVPIIRGKRIKLGPPTEDPEEPEEIEPNTEADNDLYSNVPTPIPAEAPSDPPGGPDPTITSSNPTHSRRPTVIEEEPSRKLAAAFFAPPEDLDDLYSDSPTPSFRS